MCLDVDYDEESELIEHGFHVARKAHECGECHRQIERGERYRYWKLKDGWSGKLTDERMCPHCWATIELGSAITGCPKFFYWGLVHDRIADDGGFVGDIIINHDLSVADRVRMLRRVVQFRRQWRRPNGELYPLPAIPVAA